MTVSPEDIRAAIAEGTGTDGPTLFAEVRSALRRYLHWSEQWAYDLGALWVMQAKIASEQGFAARVTGRQALGSCRF